jgi:proteasome lid subunit RPN8/RPN11
MNPAPESTVITWSVPQCPFTIQCSARVLDDIRLAIVDAFFSLPRGGAEIGGLLLGRYERDRLLISGYRPLECEHAFGPSFTLSERDFARLRDMLAAAGTKPGEPQPVGWYHSHTRSEIFLSDADREIHEHYFRQPWQVAMVLRPHTFHPTRAGFFFREADGHIRTEESYQEIQLTPLALPAASGDRAPASPEPAPVASPTPPLAGTPPPAATPPTPPPRIARFPAAPPTPVLPPAPPAPLAEMPIAALPAAPPAAAPMSPISGLHYLPKQPRITLDAVAEVPVEEPPAKPQQAPPKPVLPPAAAPLPVEGEPATVPDASLPRFLAVEMPSRKRYLRWVWLSAALVVLGGCGYLTRGLWWDETVGTLVAGAPTLGLRTLENNGQLQIQWDPHSPALRKPKGARLTILDGPKLRAFPLDVAHLASGVFTYSRQTEKVDATLAITEPNGRIIREQTTFMGSPAVVVDIEAVKQRDNLRTENEQLKSDLAKERDKNAKQEKQVRYLRDQLERELRLRRLEKQINSAK